MSNDDTPCSADRLWSEENKCGDLPLSFALLFGVSAGWGLLFIFAGLRMIYMLRSSPMNTTVAKKMQFVQAWFYSYFHTMVSLVVLFAAGALFVDGQAITAALLLGFYAVDIAYSSQVDVIGTIGREQGINNVSLSVIIQYVFTTYLAKAVWKLTGHPEFKLDDSEAEEVEKKQSKFSKMCCLSPLYNSFSPRVYDFKDVIGIQGAFVGLPVLATLLLAVVRTNEDIEESTIEDVYLLNPLEKMVASVAFVSALLTPLLGDWETYSKKILYCLFSFVMRVFELVARVSFYVYFLDYSKFAGLILLAAEFFVMWMTNVDVANTSAAGRIATFSHKLLSSWVAIFFTNYRRVHVDKDMISQNLTLMPPTIELVRFLERTLATLIGYIVIVAGGVPESYTEVIDGFKTMPIIFFAGVAANGLVVLFNMVYFFFINRKELSTSQLGLLKSYWMSFCLCRCLCGSPAAYVNRDDNNYPYHGSQMHYL